MATSYTPKVGMGIPALGDTGWNVPLAADFNLLDSLAPIGGLAVRAKEIPSTSLNVSVAAGNYAAQDGSVSNYAGTTSQAIPGGTTRVLYLDLTSSGALTVATSYPTTPHVRLATVVTGGSSITSIADDRLTAQHSGQRIPSLTHLLSTAAAAPTIAAGAAAGTGPTVTLTNASDLGGLITVTVGTSPTTGTLATVTFGTAFGATPRAVILTPAGSNSAPLTGIYANASNLTTAHFTIDTTSALVASQSYKWAFLVVG